LLVENTRLLRSGYGLYNPGFANHVYRDLRIVSTGIPFVRVGAQYGPMTVDGLTFIRCGDSLIQIAYNNPTGKAVSHFRNVKATKEGKYQLLGMVGGADYPAVDPQSVPTYLHDFFGAKRHAKVATTLAKDFGADGLQYREEPPLTGHSMRVTEVK